MGIPPPPLNEGRVYPNGKVPLFLYNHVGAPLVTPSRTLTGFPTQTVSQRDHGKLSCTYVPNTNELNGSSRTQCIVKSGRVVKGRGWHHKSFRSKVHYKERRMSHHRLWSRSFSPEWFYYDACGFSTKFAGGGFSTVT